MKGLLSLCLFLGVIISSGYSSQVYSYDNSFIAVSSNQVIKKSLNGDLLWQSRESSMQLVKILFNQILTQDSKSIKAMSVENSALKWQLEINSQTKIVVFYPYIVLYDRHKIACLDFFTGQEIWVKDLALQKPVVLFDQIDQLFIQDKNNRFKISLFDGKLKQLPTEEKKTTVLYVDSNKLYFQDKTHFYEQNMNTLEKKILFSASNHILFSAFSSVIVHDEDKQKVMSFNLKFKRENWALFIKKDFIKMTLNYPYLVLLFQDEVRMIHLLDKDDCWQAIHDLTEKQIQSCEVFGFDRKKLYFFLTSQEIIKLNMKKHKNENIR